MIEWSLVELRRGGDKVMLQIFASTDGKLPIVRGTIMTEEHEIEERVKWQQAIARMNSGVS
ncbi:MAG: hypothetical protein ACYSW3_30750 [Planctomycetota bacterium]|jgi:hypothetical protein